METTGSTALVTGGSRRVGRAITLALARAGANVAVHYNRSDEDAANVAKEAESLGARCTTLQANLSSPAEAAGLVDAVFDTLGSLDILVNNASPFSRGTLEQTSVEEWDDYMAVMVRAPFLLAQGMQRRLGPDRPGKVINLNDWKTARRDRFAYGASKAALSGLTRSLAIAMAPNIQVNELALGAILPPADLVADQQSGLRVAKASPAGRMGSVEEVANAVISLVENDFITGETLHVDGGRHVR